MADRYIVAAGNWSSTSVWATSSGGAPGASVPGTGDNVFLDAASGAVTSTITTITVGSVDCTGFTGTLAGTQALTLDGAGGVFKLNATMSYTRSGATTFQAASGTTQVTLAGKTLGAVTINGASLTVETLDAFACGAMALTAGTFDVNGGGVAMTSLSATTNNTRVINMGTAGWTISGSGTVWNLTNLPSVTINRETCTDITFSNNGSLIFVTGAKTYPKFIVSASPSNAPFSISGTGATIAEIVATAPRTILFPGGGTTTIETASTFVGSPTDRLFIGSGTTGTAATIANGTTGTREHDYLVVKDITFSGSITHRMGRHSIDLGGNSATGGGTMTFTSTVTHKVDGTTLDKDGSALGSCEVVLFKKLASGDAEMVSRGTSHASTGAFTLDAYDTDTQHYVVSRKTGSPNVHDVSDYVTPVSI